MSEEEAPYKVTTTGKVIHNLEQTKNLTVPPEPPECPGWEQCASAAKKIKELEDKIDILQTDRNHLRGAMHAQDKREEDAGRFCGVTYDVHGCDWPMAAAELIVHLRSELAEVKSDLSEARDTLNEKEE